MFHNYNKMVFNIPQRGKAAITILMGIVITIVAVSSTHVSVYLKVYLLIHSVLHHPSFPIITSVAA